MLFLLLSLVWLEEPAIINFHRPVWSPDGSQMAFMSDSVGNWELFIWDQKSSKPVRITHAPSFDGYAFWSPDATDLVFGKSSKETGNTILLYNIKSGKTKVLTQPNSGALGAKFSPDGTQIIHMREQNGVRHIYTMNRQGKQLKRLTSDVSSFYDDPVYHPKGKQIAFSRKDANDHVLCVMDLDRKLQKELTRAPNRFYGLWWSPDGQWLVYNNAKAESADIYKISMSGGAPIRLTENHHHDHLAVWLKPNRIAFTSYRSGKEEIYTMDANGKNVKKLAMPIMPTK